MSRLAATTETTVRDAAGLGNSGTASVTTTPGVVGRVDDTAGGAETGAGVSARGSGDERADSKSIISTGFSVRAAGAEAAPGGSDTAAALAAGGGGLGVEAADRTAAAGPIAGGSGVGAGVVAVAEGLPVAARAAGLHRDPPNAVLGGSNC